MSLLLSVSIALRDLIYLSYPVPAARLREFVPTALPLNTIEKEWGLLSIVLMKNTAVRPAWLPWSPIVYDQLNLRTYVRDPHTGEEAVFFIESAINSRLMLLGPRLFSLPWEYMPITFRSLRGQRGNRASYVAGGLFHDPIDIEVRAMPEDKAPPGPYETEEAIRHITTPQIGYMASGERVHRFRVAYPHVPPVKGEVVRCLFPYVVSKGLLTEAEVQKPSSVLIVDRVDFLVLMPPKRLIAGPAGRSEEGGL